MHDPREAPMAAAYAEIVAARENPIPLGVPVLALLGVGAVAVAVSLFRKLGLRGRCAAVFT